MTMPYSDRELVDILIGILVLLVVGIGVASIRISRR